MNMNFIKRSFASTSRRLNASPASVTTPDLTMPKISPVDLPPVIYNLISRHLASHASGQPLTIPNPFLSRRVPVAKSGPSKTSYRYVERTISRRREKQLLESYPSVALPRSELNRKPASPTIEWTDGTQISWSGRLPSIEGKKTLYSGRRVMFKGHKHERQKEERKKETAERLKGMDKRIREWRDTQRETKTAARPSIPF